MKKHLFTMGAIALLMSCSKSSDTLSPLQSGNLQQKVMSAQKGLETDTQIVATDSTNKDIVARLDNPHENIYYNYEESNIIDAEYSQDLGSELRQYYMQMRFPDFKAKALPSVFGVLFNYANNNSPQGNVVTSNFYYDGFNYETTWTYAHIFGTVDVGTVTTTGTATEEIKVMGAQRIHVWTVYAVYFTAGKINLSMGRQ